MHVIFTSSCKGKALQRTRKILDRYARRVGPTSWATPITQEALTEVHRLLRKTATKNTAVACHLNKGMRSLELKFIVGNKSVFSDNGAYPVRTGKKPPRKLSAYAKLVTACADLAGFFHDVGKATKHFQDKLSSPLLEKDPLRHELISTAVLDELLKGSSFSEAWKRLGSSYNYEPLVRQLYGFKDRNAMSEIDSVEKVLQLLVLTHHKIKNTKVADAKLEAVDTYKQKDSAKKAELKHPFSPEFNRTLVKKLATLRKIQQREAHRSKDSWLKVFHDARTALILADHEVSARIFKENTKAKLYANTRLDADNGCSTLNQPLEYHLAQVSQMAAQYAKNIAEHTIPGLPSSYVENTLTQTSSAKFKWQDEAVAFLKAEPRSTPALVFNLAGTGAGKTFMNVKALLALNPRDAISVALNLRTLTLQTASALQSLLGVDASQLACVMGDRATAEWQKHLKKQVRDDDENGDDVEVVVNSTDFDTEPWAETLIHRFKYAPPLLAAPILVSTTDYLVEASALPRQARHALSLLRVSKSSLVLDEVDSYDAKAMVSVIRLIFIAGMYRKNVVLSSATLSPPIATLARDAYMAGLACTEEETVPPKVYIVSDKIAPRAFELSEFTASDYSDYASSMFAIPSQTTKLSRIIPLDQEKISGPELESKLALSLWEECLSFHAEHHVVDPVSGKRVSLGLIRVANISTAIPLSIALTKLIGKKGGVCCYHSRHFALARFVMEKELDKVLTRKTGNPVLEHPNVREILQQTDASDIYLVVVATPVEEVGRDHDFDYALIEPSSAQSIIQTAGRVNRHRQVLVDTPNIGIWQYPVSLLRDQKRSENTKFFCNPGLEEDSESSYPSHDMLDLWPTSETQVTAAPCLTLDTGNGLAVADRKTLEHYLGEDSVNRVAAFPSAATNKRSEYLDASTFNHWKLRHGIPQQAHYYDPAVQKLYRVEEEGKLRQWTSIQLFKQEKLSASEGNSLFCPTLPELIALADALGWSAEDAFSFTLSDKAGKGSRNLIWHESFGLYAPSSE